MTRTLFVLMGVSPFQGLGFIVFITKPRYTLFAFYTGLLTPPLEAQRVFEIVTARSSC